MAYKIPSQAEGFAKELKEKVNSCVSYQRKAKGWGEDFDGTLLLHFEPPSDENSAQQKHSRDDLFLLLDLVDGSCNSIDIYKDEPDQEYGFLYKGTYPEWWRLFKTETRESLRDGTFQFEGDLETFLEYAPANHTLATLAQRIDTEFAEDQ